MTTDPTLYPTWKRIYLALMNNKQGEEIDTILHDHDNVAAMLVCAAVSDDPLQKKAIALLYKEMIERLEGDWNLNNFGKSLGVMINHLLHMGRSDTIAVVTERHVRKLRLVPETERGKNAMYEAVRAILGQNLLSDTEKNMLFDTASEAYAQGCRMEKSSIQRWMADVCIENIGMASEESIAFFLKKPELVAQVYWTSLRAGYSDIDAVVHKDAATRDIMDVLRGRIVGTRHNTIAEGFANAWVYAEEFNDFLDPHRYAWRNGHVDPLLLEKSAFLFFDGNEEDNEDSKKTYPYLYQHALRLKMHKEFVGEQQERKKHAL